MASKIWLLVPAIFIFILFLHPISGDGDSFHHMNTAKLVLKNYSIPQLDEFTFTAHGQPFIGNAWGAGVIYYLVFSTFGNVGISILTALLAVLTLFLLYHLLKIYTHSSKTALFSISLIIAPLSIRWPNRPETLTYPLFVSLLLIDRLKHRHPKLVYLYPLIILLWANLYGANVLLGLILLLAFIIKDVWLYHLKPKQITILFTLLAFPASYFNGYGLKSIFYIFYMPTIAAYDLEWHGIFKLLSAVSLDQLLDVQYRVLIYLIYFVIFLIIVIFSFKKILAHLWLTILGLSVFIPLLTFRQIPLATLLSIPLLTTLLTYQIKEKRCYLVGCVALLALIAFLISFWINFPKITPDPNLFPEKIVDFIQKHNLSGKVFANQRIGPYLTYHLYPKVLVFIDTRDELFLNTSVIADSLRFRKNIEALFEKYQVDLVLVDLSDGDLYKSLFYSQNWALVFLYDNYALFIPKTLALDKNISMLDALDPYSSSQAKGGKEEEALNYYQKILLESPHMNDQLRLSYTLISLKKYNEAIEILSKINTGFSPPSALYSSVKNYLLAQSYLSLGDCLNSEQFLDKTQSDISHKLIFQPQKKLPSEVNKGFALYFKNCQKDEAKAKTYYNLYLNQNDITPLDKLKFEKEFTR